MLTLPRISAYVENSGRKTVFGREKEKDNMATVQALTKLLVGRKVDSVRQRESELDIDFEDGSTLTVKLAAPAGGISLMGSDDKPQYTG